MSALQRLTTEYIEFEDRMRISGEGVHGELLAFWLTQRLLTRIIRFLVTAIEQSSTQATAKSAPDARTSALVNELAQEAAAQSLIQQPPVVASNSEKIWLVNEVDINKSDQYFTLRFKNMDAAPADVIFDHQQLRQWLVIVFNLWQKAEWPLHIWPEWITGTAKNPASKTKSAMH